MFLLFSWPNLVTLTRVAGAPVFVLCCHRAAAVGTPAARWSAALLFALIVGSDVLDGLPGPPFAPQQRVRTIPGPRCRHFLHPVRAGLVRGLGLGHWVVAGRHCLGPLVFTPSIPGGAAANPGGSAVCSAAGLATSAAS